MRLAAERPWRNLKRVLLVLLAWQAVGVLAFHEIEHWTWFDSLYMVITTVATVGYKEVHDLSHAGRAFNIVFIMVGVGLVFLAIGVLTQALLEFELGIYFGRRRMEREIARLKDHYVICGAGRVGRSTARELKRKPVPFVIVDSSAEKLAALPAEWLSLQGDATQEATLRQVGIEHAAGLVAAATLDATNIYIVLNARSLNPKLHILARVSEEAAEKHLLTAGANSVISPYWFAGRRIANNFLRPNVMSFLDLATMGAGERDLEIEEIRVESGSPFSGQTVESSRIRQQMGVIILAIKRADQSMKFNPASDDRIEAGDYLIAMGEPSSLRRLEQSAAGSA
jgi:voltage-gated potassium channel